jgi:hypothetical protein
MWVSSIIYTAGLTVPHVDRSHEAVDAVLVFTLNDGM